MWISLPGETLARHRLRFGVSSRSLTFIFGNHTDVQSREYVLEGHRRKQPASKSTSQRKSEGWTGRVTGMLAGLQSWVQFPHGFIGPSHLPVYGDILLPFCKGNQGVGASPGFGVVQRDGFSPFLNCKWRVRHVAYKTRHMLGAERYQGREEGACGCPPTHPPPRQRMHMARWSFLWGQDPKKPGLVRGPG